MKVYGVFTKENELQRLCVTKELALNYITPGNCNRLHVKELVVEEYEKRQTYQLMENHKHNAF